MHATWKMEPELVDWQGVWVTLDPGLLPVGTLSKRVRRCAR